VGLDLLHEFQRITRGLDEGGVPYAVVGALAVAIHGAPRATTDIDLLVAPQDVARALKISRDLGFSFEALPMRFQDGMELRRTTKIEGADTLTLDLILVDDNLKPIWESRRSLVTDWGAVWVVSREALLKMKAAAGRPRDLGDIASLEDLDR
jgi:putative nucleotidyltransferase-like protein